MFAFWRKHQLDIVFLLLIFLVALIPRVVDLGAFLTADEKNWIGRSYEFVRAFKDVRLNDMLQTTHPGATGLWLMGVAVTTKILLSHIPFSVETLPEFILVSQFVVAFANALAIPVMYLLLRKLFEDGYMLPIIASLFIALNPLLIGYSRVAHIDALLMSFIFLAALAILIYVKRDFNRMWLIVSAVLSGLAILTKAPAIFLIPFFWFVVLVRSIESNHRLSSAQSYLRLISPRFRDFTLWILIVAVMFVVIWPVFISVPNPKGNANLLRRDLGAAISTPHHMSEEYALQGSHYIYTLLARTTPIALVFALITIVLTVLELYRRRKWANEYPMLIAYIVFFVIMMTLGAKKGDRYILPVFPAIDVLAAAGVIFVSTKLTARFGTYVGRGVQVLPVLYLLLVTATYHPYAIAYASPLFPDNLSQELGWGEGLEQVAEWLNEHDPKAHVASWYDQELGAFTSARTVSIGAHEQSHIKYVVLYRNMFGRAADHPANDYIDEYFSKRDPVFIAYVAGKEFAWVYEKQVYEKTTGELLPGVIVKQSITAANEPLVGLEVQVATYNGRASTGTLLVILEDEDGSVIHTWEVPVASFEDDSWHRFLLPTSVNIDQVAVKISAQGTTEGNAPTIRRSAIGKTAVRLLYGTLENPFHEEQTRLFHR